MRDKKLVGQIIQISRRKKSTDRITKHLIQLEFDRPKDIIHFKITSSILLANIKIKKENGRY